MEKIAENRTNVMYVPYVSRWDYADQMLRVLLAEPRFEWPARSAADWRDAPVDHIVTRYEAKRLGDCSPVWLDFIRRSD